MADKSLLELPLATSIGNALVYGVQDNQDVAIPAQLFGQDSEPVPANTFYAGPISPPGGLPAFRPLVAADIPDLSNVYLKSNNGTLVSPTINNAQIVGGTLSGVVATFDDDKLIVRNVTDTTKRARWNMAPIPAGTTAVFSVPNASTTLVGTDSDQTLTNKKVVVKASTSASAGLTLPIGVPPSSPAEGDVWITAAGMYARVSGATIGPFAPALSSAVTSFNGRTGAITLSSGDVTGALGFAPYNPAAETYVRKTGDNMSGPLTATDFIDGSGSLRSAVNGKVNRSGDTMTGALVVSGGNISTGVGQSFLSGSGVFRSSSATVTIASGGAGHFVSLRPNGEASTVGEVTVNSSGVVNIADGRIQSDTNHFIDIGRAGLNRTDFGSFTGAFNFINTQTYTNVLTLSGGNLNAAGVITAGGGFGPGSDPLLKEEDSLEEIHDAVEKVYNLNVRKGRYKDWYNPDGKERIFLMADNAMEQYAPNVFQKDMIDSGGKKYNGWSADQMIALLVKTVQELTDRIEDLEGRLDEQQN